MNSIHRRLSQLFVSGLTAGLCLLSSLQAQADVCFSKPVLLPGLEGPPDWITPGTVRTELNEPRWAAAPQLGFESDDTDSEGVYRLVMNEANTEISVSFQVPMDPGNPSNADVIYFGFTKDGVSASLATAVRIGLTTNGTDPVAPTNVRAYSYDVAATPQWKPAPPLTKPDWLKEPAAWRNDATAAWGINFKVDLTAPSLGSIDVTAPLKILLAMHVRDELTSANSFNPSTPNPACAGPGCPYPLLAGTLFIRDPVNWATTAALNAGCSGSVSISGTQLGTTNQAPPGSPAPNSVNTADGAINTFYARPAYTIAPYVDMITGKFHVANWGSVPAFEPPISGADAPWIEITQGSGVNNGAPPSADVGELSFTCPINTPAQTCGYNTPSEPLQSIYVELHPAAGQTVSFTDSAAHRSLRFEELSQFSAPAEISVKGLKRVFGNDEPRRIFLYVHAKNLPPHQEAPIQLPTEKMAATKRFADTPPRLPKGTPQQPSTQPAPTATTDKATKPRQMDLPDTGVGDLALTAEQALRTVWPTYEVRPFYQSDEEVDVNGQKVKRLRAMYPFTYHHSHKGELYGFTHLLQGAGEIEVKQLRPGLYYLEIPSESVAHVVTTVQAHEAPLSGHTPDHPGTVPPGRCNCSTPGYGDGYGLARNLGLLALGALSAVWLWRRRRV